MPTIPMAILVPDRKTPIPLEEGGHALLGAYRLVLGGLPSPRALACLLAQLCLESGNFLKAHCFNWGNKKMPAEWDGLCCQFMCDEIFDAATMKRAQALGPTQVSLWKGGPKWRVVLIPPHPWSTFCAFERAEEGAAEYLKLLVTHERFRAAWRQALAGHPQEFSEALGVADYYTADVALYTHGLVKLFEQLLPLCERLVASEPHGVDEPFRLAVQELVARTLNESRLDLLALSNHEGGTV